MRPLNNLENTISLAQFKDIVGTGKFTQLENYGTSNSTYSEDFLLLHKIYNTLSKSSEIVSIPEVEDERINLEIQFMTNKMKLYKHCQFLKTVLNKMMKQRYFRTKYF